MVIVDVNILVNAVHVGSPHHESAKSWLNETLQKGERIVLPWAVIVGFVRVSTNTKLMATPYSIEEALQQIEDWLALPGVDILSETSNHARIFSDLCRAASVAGNLVTDAHLAALAIEHECELASNDTDFARFPGLRWINPAAR